MRTTAFAITIVFLGLLVACSAPQEADPMETIDPAPKAASLELERPVTDHFAGADSDRHRYIVKVIQPGLMVVNLTWNNPEGLDRLVLQAGGGEMDTVYLLTKQEIVHSKRVEPGYYYLELIPGPAPVSYNLLASMTDPGAGG